MRAGKIILIVIMVIGFAAPALALSIGPKGELKTGMKLKDAFNKLGGFPDAVVVKRGASSSFDHLEMSYPTKGIVIRAMSGGKTVEAIEILPGFKGTFDGLELGATFSSIVNKYGPPVTLHSQMASYPKEGFYFLFSNKKLLSAKMFSKKTKLLELQLVKP